VTSDLHESSQLIVRRLDRKDKTPFAGKLPKSMAAETQRAGARPLRAVLSPASLATATDRSLASLAAASGFED
jgi:hypothetical protein